MNEPCELSAATAFNNSIALVKSCFKTAENADQAARLSSFTAFLASAAMVVNSSSVAMFCPSASNDKIHSLNLAMQSNSDSHFKRSSDLYRSCEPDVEWPCG